MTILAAISDAKILDNLCPYITLSWPLNETAQTMFHITAVFRYTIPNKMTNMAFMQGTSIWDS